MENLIINKVGKVMGELVIPGSKSYSNRALIMAAIAKGESVLKNISLSDDTRVLIECLKKLGVGVEMEGDVAMVSGGNFISYKGKFDVGPAGTAMRFLTALCSFLPGVEVVIRGSERMHRRPIGDLVKALIELGARIEYLGEEECPPLKIKGVNGVGAKVKMNGAVSSQFFSALLLIAPMIGAVEVEVTGEQISNSYLDMTFSGMRDFGVETENFDYKKYVVKSGQNYLPRDYFVEGDASGGSYFWGLAGLSGGRVKVIGLNGKSLQGDVGFAKLLEKMGCEVKYGENFIEVSGSCKLRSIEADMSSMPDTAQTLAVVAAFAEGATRITGLSTLKNKETDRLIATKNELEKIGIKSDVGEDFIVIYGAGADYSINKACIDTYDDHRMAMAFSLLAVKVETLEITCPAVVGKSFPNYWDIFGSLTKTEICSIDR